MKDMVLHRRDTIISITIDIIDEYGIHGFSSNLLKKIT